MQVKYLTYFLTIAVLVSCTNPSKQTNESKQNGTSTHTEENELNHESKATIDSTVLIGKWMIEDSDREILEYRYVGGMPESFSIDDLSQIRRGLLVADSNNARYPFMVNHIDFDSLILRLHPGACLCEGLEARYRMESE